MLSSLSVQLNLDAHVNHEAEGKFFVSRRKFVICSCVRVKDMKKVQN